MECAIKYILLSTIFWWNAAAQEPCFLNLIGDQSPLFRPFVFTEDNKFYQSQNNVIKVMHGKTVTLSCENNFFRNNPKKSELSVQCRDDNLYIVGGDTKPVTFKELSCDLRAMEEVQHDVVDCPAKHQGISYQYFDKKTGVFNHLAEVCYDNVQLRNVFTHIVVSENDFFLKYEQHNDNKLQNNANVHHRIGVLSAYRVDKIKTSLDKTLGEDFPDVGETIGAVKLPPTLFFNDQLQDVQKFPANYVGMWSSVRDGNWKRLIADIKNYSRKQSLSLNVYFGTHEVLGLPGSKGNAYSELYLDGNKHPVPKYVWTVVHEKKSQASVAIVTINNPFISEAELNDVVFCSNICSQVKWLADLVKNQNNERPIYGYTFCCAIEALPYLESVKGATKKVLK